MGVNNARAFNRDLDSFLAAGFEIGTTTSWENAALVNNKKMQINLNARTAR